ncbi:Nucleolar Complex 2 protein [Loxospora ochrophaea]|nr:Nucleolar Complex 2 protein [Loxospora ochrophaea]
MAGRTKKSTKKFEKNHLKDTINRRKEFTKIKQRHQAKASKRARNGVDKASVSDPATQGRLAEKNTGTDRGGALKDMTVDEFFQGQLEIPEAKQTVRMAANHNDNHDHGKKRKRITPDEERNSENSGSATSIRSHELSAPSSGSELEESELHMDELDALAEKDPEFYKFLKENDEELLEFSNQGDLATAYISGETREIPNKKRKTDKKLEPTDLGKDNEVSMATIVKWKNAMTGQHSLRAMREVILAFRSAVKVNEEDGKDYKYSISNPEVYHQILSISLKHIPDVLNEHLPVKESSSGKIRVATDSKKFKTLTPLLKSHATSINHLLGHLSDTSTIRLTLSSISHLLPYLLSFKKDLKNLVKTVINVWSDPSSAETARIDAFLLIRRLAVISDSSLREAVLKTTYQGLVKGSRNTTVHTLAGINLMKNTAAELWGMDPSIGYTSGFTYIRQLAIHLRGTITQPTKDSYKAVYNWQYVHSLDYWSRVLATHCSPNANQAQKVPSDSPLHPLIYPLVQVTLGALRLIPTPTYFPLRFHLTRSLLRISRTTNTYIPLAPSLLEVLQSPELRKPPKPSTLKPLDFKTSIRAPKSYSRTRIYQDGIGEQVSELLADFFGIWSKNIAFPELVIPPTVLLKRWLKEVSSPPTNSKKSASRPTSRNHGKGNKNQKLNSSISLLIQKLDANARWVEERRRKVTFAPSNRVEVEGFLKEVEPGDTPLGAYFLGMRAQKEEREKMMEESRLAEEEQRGREKDQDDGQNTSNYDDEDEDEDDDGDE